MIRACIQRRRLNIAMLAGAGLAMAGVCRPAVSGAEEVRQPNPVAVGHEVDQLIEQTLDRQGKEPSALIEDGAFLRRASLGITGHLPTPEEMTRFVLDPDPEPSHFFLETDRPP